MPSFSFIATTNAPVYVGARPVFADVEPATGNLTAETIAAVLTPATKAVILVDQGGVPVDVDAVRALCDPRGDRRRRGRRLRGRIDLPRAPGRRRGADRRVVVPPAQDHHHRRGRDAHHRRRRLGRARPPAAGARDERQRAPTGTRARCPPAEEYLEVGYNYRMTDLQAAVGLVQLGSAGRRSSRAGARSPRATARHSPASPGLRMLADPAWGTTNFQSFWVEVLPDVPARPRGPARPSCRGGDLGPARDHGGPPPARVRRSSGSAAAGDRAADRPHADPAGVPPDDRDGAGPGHRLPYASRGRSHGG